MSIGTTAALTIAGITAAGAIGSSVIGAHAAGSAADKQVAQENKALDVQQQSLDYTKQVESPYISAGNTSLSTLMDAIKSGKFGAGSLPSLNIQPFTDKFTLPTAEEAAKTPGYQFALEQGDLGINRGAAAAGGAFTGGTLKALAGYNSGLASTTYQNTVQNALAGYNASLAGYQTNTNASLQSYQAALAKQAQEYQQLYNPAVLGANAAASTSTNVANQSNGIAGTYGNIGTSQAAGIVGGANAITSGITGATNGISDALLLQTLNRGGAGLPGYSGPIGVPGSPGYVAPTPYQAPPG